MGKSNAVRLAGIAYESLVNGPGIRRVLFAQGCIHDCEGCFNQDTHSFNGGISYDMDDILRDIQDNPMLRGITFSGGDPFEQADKFAYLAKNIHDIGLNIWCYTGYTFEYIIENKDRRIGWAELLKYIDVLVDGPFIQEKQSMAIKFRGSYNQRIIDVQKSEESGKIVVLDYDN
ncbi:anaerobic ribonucleoside-triphosphate reductase activating protein [Clostridium oryzae]|uniref:Anaerobic ribonucleoside-triphosphate reductase-activating protein n=1 Tax=Clostridium oryzae TaxID=1450648 RepID=A0A1V4IMM5_9CLOT|nr:anaerobic ribonucleoside-triphosphate reductase activating protein [Clostridium oryzae]OPJ61282.1 pyruvate formate-lyase 1-activating enzyme [Clostridium oryzae]